MVLSYLHSPHSNWALKASAKCQARPKSSDNARHFLDLTLNRYSLSLPQWNIKKNKFFKYFNIWKAINKDLFILYLHVFNNYFWNNDNYKYIFLYLFCTIIGQFTRLLRSLELRAVSHCTVLLLWDQKLLFRIRYCFEGSIIHLPTLWLDAIDTCITYIVPVKWDNICSA